MKWKFLIFFSGKNIYNIDADSLEFINFSDTFNFTIEHANIVDPNVFSIGNHDSLMDKGFNTWHLSRIGDDPDTPIRENKLINNTIIFYFKQTNIKYYIQEGVPYFYCECKHVAVKQSVN